MMDLKNSSNLNGLSDVTWTLDGTQDATHPVYLLDLMVLCWSQQPKDRPTASQIVSIATAPEFIHLLDVVSVNHSGYITGGTAVPLPNAAEEELHELWLSSTACQVTLILLLTPGRSNEWTAIGRRIHGTGR